MSYNNWNEYFQDNDRPDHNHTDHCHPSSSGCGHEPCLPEETEQQVRLVRRVSRARPAEMETPVPPARQANRGRPAEMEAPVRPVRQVHRDRQAGTETPARPVRRAHRDQQDLQGRMAPQGHRGSLEKPGRLALRAGPELMEPTEPTGMSAPRE